MFVEVANFIFTFGLSLFQSISTTWGIIGMGLLSTFLLLRVVNFIKRFFR